MRAGPVLAMMWTMRPTAVALSAAIPFLLLAATACSTPTPTPPPTPAPAGPFDALVGVAYDRLATADTVAASKWSSHGAVEDPAREQAVLDAAATGAARRGLDPAVVAAVFRDQIQASKVVQYGLLEDWTAEPAHAPGAAPDLASIRPVLDGVTPRLLDALAATTAARRDGTCPAQVATADDRAAAEHGLDAVHRRGLERALRSICG